MSLANDILNVEQNIKKVDSYFLKNSENLPYKEVVSLSMNIIESRKNYTVQTLGKTFILLSDVAKNRGEDDKALQFAQDGMLLQGLDKALNFNLLLKVAGGYYLKEKYEKTQTLATGVIFMAKSPDMLEYRLIALSYRAVSFALQNKNKLAENDLKQIKVLKDANPQYEDHIRLLEILARAHYYLKNYQTSLSMQNHLLTLRFDLGKVANIDQTYLHLAQAYFKLDLLDDAYNAYWEAQKYSKEKGAPIRSAYAELGLAEVLLKQKEYQTSHNRLLSASIIFNEENLRKPYLTSLILLAETALFLDDQALYQHYLQLAELMAKDVRLSKKQSKLLLLLSDMYKQNGDYKNALLMQTNYLELLEQFKSDFVPPNNTLVHGLGVNDRVGEQNNGRIKYKNKYYEQKKKYNQLIVVIILLLVILVLIVLKQRTNRLNQVYDEVELPLSFIATPSQTKRRYQLTYKMARKYNYPLAVGYLSVTNWHELSFHFNRKIMLEVAKTLATLLNQSKSEFDEVGEINEGEYLLLGPHQTEEEIAVKLNSLAEAIKVRFFANLGDYTVKIGYAYGLPVAQDIDPYIFLSRLSEATKA
jgi:uncharacterized integral membrane protein